MRQGLEPVEAMAAVAHLAAWAVTMAAAISAGLAPEVAPVLAEVPTSVVRRASAEAPASAVHRALVEVSAPVDRTLAGSDHRCPGLRQGLISMPNARLPFGA